jgi:hypothetical protein
MGSERESQYQPARHPETIADILQALNAQTSTELVSEFAAVGDI